MVKSKFGFFQKLAESNSEYSIEFPHPAFSITPEFNAIDMMLAPSKFIGTVVHSKSPIKTSALK